MEQRIVNVEYTARAGARVKKEVWKFPGNTTILEVYKALSVANKENCIRISIRLSLFPQNYFADIPDALNTHNTFAEIVLTWHSQTMLSKKLQSFPNKLTLQVHLGAEKSNFLLQVGQTLDVFDKHKKWYQSQIVGMRNKTGDEQVMVHFLGFKKTWNEWISVSEEHRFAKLGTKAAESKYVKFDEANLVEGTKVYCKLYLLDDDVFVIDQIVLVQFNKKDKLVIQTTKRVLMSSGELFQQIFSGDPDCNKISISLPTLSCVRNIARFLKTEEVVLPESDKIADFILCADFLQSKRLLAEVSNAIQEFLNDHVIPDLNSLPLSLLQEVLPFDLKQASYNATQLKLLKAYVLGQQEKEGVFIPNIIFNALTHQI